jgi:hypothetical protein
VDFSPRSILLIIKKNHKLDHHVWEHPMLYSDPAFSLFFGDNRTVFDPENFRNGPPLLEGTPPFSNLQGFMNLKELIFLNQVHGVGGRIIMSVQEAMGIKPFSCDGDILITPVAQIGLGVASADCLPIACYDPVNHVAAIAHAGWRGTVKGIASKTLKILQNNFRSDPAHVKIFFGPAARACCYEVGADFIQRLEDKPFLEQVIRTVQGKYYFDGPLYNRCELEAAGVKPEHINTCYNMCTICDRSFCSYRRESKATHRQMTIIALK